MGFEYLFFSVTEQEEVITLDSAITINCTGYKMYRMIYIKYMPKDIGRNTQKVWEIDV